MNSAVVVVVVVVAAAAAAAAAVVVRQMEELWPERHWRRQGSQEWGGGWESGMEGTIQV